LHRSFTSLVTRASSGCLGTMEVKSKFGAEFCWFSLERSKSGRFEEFYGLLQHLHKIPSVDLLMGFADLHGDLLPINNDDNYHKAISTANPLLRIFIQKKVRSLRFRSQHESMEPSVGIIKL
uniref:PB1 domain-containing protein n=1 Tax=Sciurus vulgaris TaxID=55149 RepID=A0A8D2DMF3_SCIVU